MITKNYIYNLNNLLTVPDREPLLGDFCKQGDFGVIHGPYGSGKTWMALAMALALVSGHCLGGCVVPRKRRVAYLDWQGPLDSLKVRLALLIDGSFPEPTNLVIQNPKIVAKRLKTGVVNFSILHNCSTYFRQLRRAGVEVIVIDSLQRFTRATKLHHDQLAGIFTELQALGMTFIVTSSEVPDSANWSLEVIPDHTEDLIRFDTRFSRNRNSGCRGIHTDIQLNGWFGV